MSGSPTGMLLRGMLCVCARGCLSGCGASKASEKPDGPVRITGGLSSNDVVQITTLVRQYNIRWSTNSHPVKSIAVLSNGTVEVWFTAKELHWGEGGNILEKRTNGWQIIGELFR